MKYDYRPPLAMSPCGRISNPETRDCVEGHESCPFGNNYLNNVIIIK